MLIRFGQKVDKMKAALVILALIPLVLAKSLAPRPRFHAIQRRCMNMWDEGCINGQLSGSGASTLGEPSTKGAVLGFVGRWRPVWTYNEPITITDLERKRCVNMWDEGCINGVLAGSGGDDSYLNGGFNPGKRCVNMWDEGCINGVLAGSGGDDSYLNGGFNPGKRCVNMWDEGCINGVLAGSGGDDSYLNGGFNPGKRCVNMWDEGCINGVLAGSGGDDNYLNGGFNPGKRSLHEFMSKLKKNGHKM